MSFSLSKWPLSTKSGVGVWEDRGSSWQELGCSGQMFLCCSMINISALEKFTGGGWWWVGGTVKITSAPGPDHLILNWNRLDWLKIDLEWTRNGPGLNLDLNLSLTKSEICTSLTKADSDTLNRKIKVQCAKCQNDLSASERPSVRDNDSQDHKKF